MGASKETLEYENRLLKQKMADIRKAVEVAWLNAQDPWEGDIVDHELYKSKRWAQRQALGDIVDAVPGITRESVS